MGLSINENNNLRFDYTALVKGSNSITVGWDFTNICNELFELQGFSLINDTLLSNNIVFQTTSNRLEIPLERTSIDGSPVHFRLVAIQNGSICSGKSTETTYYRFDGNAAAYYCSFLLSQGNLFLPQSFNLSRWMFSFLMPLICAQRFLQLMFVAVALVLHFPRVMKGLLQSALYITALQVELPLNPVPVDWKQTLFLSCLKMDQCALQT